MSTNHASGLKLDQQSSGLVNSRVNLIGTVIKGMPITELWSDIGLNFPFGVKVTREEGWGGEGWFVGS